MSEDRHRLRVLTLYLDHIDKQKGYTGREVQAWLEDVVRRADAASKLRESGRCHAWPSPACRDVRTHDPASWCDWCKAAAEYDAPAT